MSWLRRLALIALGLGVALGHARATETKRPNVLFIAIDDLNDWVGCLGGHPQVSTPNIDRLAKRGVLFTNAHCQAPICNPSRVSLLTGVRPSTSGVYDLNQPLRSAPALKGAMTLPANFKAGGYHVLGRGKIYHGKPYADEWHDFEVRPDARNKQFRVKPISRLPKIRVRDFGPIDLPEEQFGDVINAQWAAESLQRDFGKPFFMAVGIRLPHVPLYAPQKYFDRHPVKGGTLPRIRPDDLADLPPAGIEITRYMDKTPLNHEAIHTVLAGTGYMDLRSSSPLVIQLTCKNKAAASQMKGLSSALVAMGKTSLSAAQTHLDEQMKNLENLDEEVQGMIKNQLSVAAKAMPIANEILAGFAAQSKENVVTMKVNRMGGMSEMVGIAIEQIFMGIGFSQEFRGPIEDPEFLDRPIELKGEID